MADDGPAPSLRTRLACLTLAALAVRGVALALTADIPCLRDECSYLILARDLAGGRGFLPREDHFWPPGNIAFLAAIFAAGGGVVAAKLVQVLLSTLLVPLTFVCAESAARPWGAARARRAALLASALIAFDPTLVAYSHYFWPETLFLPFFLGGLLLVARMGESLQRGIDARSTAVAAGVVFGLACLIKIVPLYLLPLLAVWLGLLASAVSGTAPTTIARRMRPGLLAGLLLLTAAGATIAPWAVRNTLAHGRLVLIETTGGKNLVRGNNPYAPSNWDWGDHRHTYALQATGCFQDNLVDRDRCLTGAALRYIASHPGQFLRDAWIKLADLVNPTSFAVRHIRLGVYGDWPAPLASLAVVVIALFNVVLMAGAVVGWAGAPASVWRSLAVLVMAYTLAVHVFTFGMSRFRLPLEPLLAIGTAIAFVGRGAELSRRARSRRWGADLALFLLVLLWAARVDGLFHEPAPGERLPTLGVDVLPRE